MRQRREVTRTIASQLREKSILNPSESNGDWAGVSSFASWSALDRTALRVV